MFEHLAENARKLHWSVRLFLFATLCVYIAYEVYFNRGLWRFFTTVQLKILGGEYYPVLSLALSVLILLVPVAIVQYLLVFLKLFPSKDVSENKDA